MSGLDPCSKEYAQQTLDIGLPMTLHDCDRYIRAAEIIGNAKTIEITKAMREVVVLVKQQVDAPEMERVS